MSKLFMGKYILPVVALIIIGTIIGVWSWRQNSTVTLIAAGDIADCSTAGDEATALLVDKLPGTVATLGDNVYPVGLARTFNECYDSSWGRFKDRTRPSAGNHEYSVQRASGYFKYFGSAAGNAATGYYSYNVGAWHVIVLNSNCENIIGGCQAGSPQEQWLRSDLAAHSATCTLAYWHHPRFTSGSHGNANVMQPFWQALYDARADLVLNGHDHDYERFALQDPVGKSDPERGIREFVVGTGGKTLRPIHKTIVNSEVHRDDTFGVLKLTLHASSYEWQFIPVAGSTFTDAGSGVCH